MVTPGAAPPTVDALRRVRRSKSTERAKMRVHVLWTCHAGRAGAQPYHAKRRQTPPNAEPRTPTSLRHTNGFQLAFGKSVCIRIWILRRRALGEVIASCFLITSQEILHSCVVPGFAVLCSFLFRVGRACSGEQISFANLIEQKLADF